ncbi:MAG: hypothetical protein ACFFFB_24845, partial [Candidatus Heimdallarchaeota archaeon]
IGDDSHGKSYLVTNFCKIRFTAEYKRTIGVDFYVKIVHLLNKTTKLLVLELNNKERFRSHRARYFRGASGVIIISDISKPEFNDNLEENFQMIRHYIGDVPIMLLTFNPQSNEFKTLSDMDIIVTTSNYDEFTFSESNSEIIQDPELIFSRLAKQIITRYSISPPPKPAHPPGRTRTEFTINKYLKLKLESDNTNIYVGDKLFKQCKYLLLNIPIDGVSEFVDVESIDEAAERLDHSMERGHPRRHYIPPEIEFWGHSSNLQAWYENNYDSRILHSNLSFPLLRELVKAGDPLARKVFKDEIALRLASGHPSVVQHLINQDYLKYLNKEELETLLDDRNFIRNLPKWFNTYKDIPKWLSKRIKVKLKSLKCPSCGTKVPYPYIEKFLETKSLKCEFCSTNITENL